MIHENFIPKTKLTTILHKYLLEINFHRFGCRRFTLIFQLPSLILRTLSNSIFRFPLLNFMSLLHFLDLVYNVFFKFKQIIEKIDIFQRLSFGNDGGRGVFLFKITDFSLANFTILIVKSTISNIVCIFFQRLFQAQSKYSYKRSLLVEGKYSVI